MSWLQGLFSTKKPIEEPPDSLKIYTDPDLSNHVRLQITRNTSAEDIINSMYYIAYTQVPRHELQDIYINKVSLVLITEQANDVRVYRRILGFEKVLIQLHRKPAGILYHYQLNDCTVRRHARERKQSGEPQLGTESGYEDQKFEHVGRLEKKNKKGVYIETRGYLNQIYFGFYNIHKSKIKLFKLEFLQLYIWDDDCSNSFKVVTQKKIYFFRASKTSEFMAWKSFLERRLDSSRFRLIILQMERRILDNNLNHVNLLEESVQVATRAPEYTCAEDIDALVQYVLANSRSPLDINLLKWAILARQVLEGEVDVQSLKVLSNTWDQIATDYYSQQFKDRFPEPDQREKRKPLRSIIEFHDFGTMIEEVQSLKTSWRVERDKDFVKAGIQRLIDQIYRITHRKYVWQYQLIMRDRALVQQSKLHFLTHTRFEVPNFEFFWN